MKNYLYKIATDKTNGFFDNIVKIFLLFLSFIYGFLVFIITSFYRIGVFKKHRLSKPVISVGNITLGGVGKTPIVIFIAKFLKEKGLKPAVLIRGYMDRNSSSKCQSDEAKMIEKELDITVIVGPNRINSANEYLLNNNVDVFILDDGFQHWKLHRDLNIVAVDVNNSFGNKFLIPRGILREPISSLKRADFLVLTKTDISEKNLKKIYTELKTIKKDKEIVNSIHKPECLVDLRSNKILKLNFIKEKKICSFCSIGDPKSFEGSLLNIGANLIKNFPFIDHYVYDSNSVININRFCLENDIKIIVVTEKDVVKLDEYLEIFSKDIIILSLKINISISQGKEELLERICNIVHC